MSENEAALAPDSEPVTASCEPVAGAAGAAVAAGAVAAVTDTTAGWGVSVGVWPSLVPSVWPSVDPSVCVPSV